MYTTYDHPDRRPNEGFVGNTRASTSVKLKQYGIQHRLGHRAYDIYGQLLPEYGNNRDLFALFIAKKHWDKYDEYLRLTKG